MRMNAARSQAAGLLRAGMRTSLTGDGLSVSAGIIMSRMMLAQFPIRPCRQAKQAQRKRERPKGSSLAVHSISSQSITHFGKRMQIYYSHFNDYSQDTNHTLQLKITLLERGGYVIVYDRFWQTLKHSGQSTYTLIKDHHISSATIDKLRKNKPLTTTTINDLCRILHCQVEDIMQYVYSDQDQEL